MAVLRLNMKMNIAAILQHISQRFLIHSIQDEKPDIASTFQLKHMIFEQFIQNTVIYSFFAISETDTLFLKLLDFVLGRRGPGVVGGGTKF